MKNFQMRSNNFLFFVVRGTFAAISFLVVFCTYHIWVAIANRAGKREATIILIAIYAAIWFFLVGRSVH